MRHATHTRDEGQEGAELVWTKPRSSKRQFELQAADTTIVATLAWGRGTRAHAQWGELHYKFRRQGWLRPRILVHAADSESATEDGEATTPIATFAQRGGVLSFPDGRAFFWKKPKWMTSERLWVDGEATELARFHPARHTTVAVTTPPEATHRPELPLLILLGEYLIVLAAQDAETAGTAAAVAAVVAAS
jgi:hypothetical protein